MVRMCGRYARYTPTREFERLAGLAIDERLEFCGPLPSWNMAPGQACPLVYHVLGWTQPTLVSLYWGFIPHWAEQRPSKRPINARLETADQLPTWKRVFRFRRCLVAADGWYEWRDEDGGKQPYFHCYRDRRPFFFAGLWDEWKGRDGTVPTFAILTEPATTAEIAAVHDRMPVIVPPQSYAAWLDKGVSDPATVKTLCQPPAPNDLVVYKVSRAVNRPDADGPELIEPLG
jgi:putative SOS response-associated peptidase YedK